MNLSTDKAYNPWLYFCLFLGTSAFLSYLSASNLEKYVVLFVGSLLPVLFLVFAKTQIEVRNTDLQTEKFEKSFNWLWLVLGAILVGLRFWKLTSFFPWPTGDESSTGMIGLGLLQDSNWHFFHGFGQTPLLFHWTFALFYRWTHSPELSLWLLPALLSAALVPLTYWGTRQFCGSSFSILLFGFMASGLWPIYLGRSGYPIFVLFWEVVVLYLLFVFIQTAEKSLALGIAVVLGLVTGLGSLTTTCWAAVGLLNFMIVAWISFRNKKAKTFLAFFIPLVAALSPFLISAWNEGYGDHIKAMGFWNASTDLSGLASHFIDYWMILWGSVNETVIYGIPPGGFLNPILAALFFLGLVEIARRFSKTVLGLYLLALTLCLSTGFFSWTIQMYRVLTVLPFLFFAAALGLDRLLDPLSARKRVLLVLVVLGASLTLDLSRLAKPYLSPEEHRQAFQDTGRTYEKYEAGKILRQLHLLYGPGLLYTDLAPNTQDESLALITYPYNCAWNPELANEKPKWAALWVESHFQPFLAKRFPKAYWIVLPTADAAEDNSHLLCVMPVDPKIQQEVGTWSETYHFLMSVNLEVLDRANGKLQDDILKKVLRFYPRVPNDPFLQSVYLAKWMDIYSRERFFRPLDTQIKYQEFSGLLDGALAKGYPDPWLDAYVGRLLMLEGQVAKARQVVDHVLKIAPHNELALQLRKALDQPVKTGGPR